MHWRPLATVRFEDRREGGRHLAAQLVRMEWTDPVVLGLARGGVPVAFEIARALGAPLDVAVARKIGAPFQPEFGVGAVTVGGPPIYDSGSLAMLRLRAEDLSDVCERERAEARRRVELYRAGRPGVPLAGRDVIVVDDGLATGVTARATLRALREERPLRLVFTAPVCAPDSAEVLRSEADLVLCAAEPVDFRAVGRWYRDFGQTTDDEVLELLDEANCE
ncbi:phosphoribosyltransferase [Streptoalloteichus hindustanus]|uniref:Predicted phosphoribosyltransferase n=1 Tax=Streptoalloteichus hindustanus TaxID=2017 RepID=A0A1M5Q866_STRHI|nr:phosphoribosyltransferase family protein [Streptoalloteichus hindustanus]SHH10387.1 Predicted phosphoribosyltransferase [Streptoalloteichus hindustanus]